MRRSIASLICGALVATAPGPHAWAAMGKAFQGTRPAGLSPAAPRAIPRTGLKVGGLALGQTNRVLSPVQSALPTSPLANSPIGASAQTALPAPQALASPLRPAAAPAPAPASRAPVSTLSQMRRAAETPAPGEDAPPSEQAASAAKPFDGSVGAASSEEVPADAAAMRALKDSRNLRLAQPQEDAISAFAAKFHRKIAATYPAHDFTRRDFYAWMKYVRFFTSRKGLREALRDGALYVYRDRLESEAEREAFKTSLDSQITALGLGEDAGKDAAAAQALLRLALPPRLSYPPRLAAMIPDPKRSKLVMTNETLRRHGAAEEAFALREPALFLGPPATIKSAVVKLLASELGIPHLAVTMHPGIGEFELIGGYRPREAKIASPEQARAAVEAKLDEASRSGDWATLLEAAQRVYGALPLEAVLEAVKKDLKIEAMSAAEAGAAQANARRRLSTLAHALLYGQASLVWQDGYLTYAIRNDIWITLEELNAAPSEVSEFLNNFMRDGRLSLTQKIGSEETLSPKPGGRFWLTATMNPETDANRELLSVTLKNRWRVKHFGDLPDPEQAQILAKKFDLNETWALALVANVHKELRRQAQARVIGGEWRDGYEINFRHLLRIGRRWRHFVDAEEARSGAPLDAKRRLFLLGREAFSVYGGLMRKSAEKDALFIKLNIALNLAADAGASSAKDLKVEPERIEDLGDVIRIGDVELPKGPGGPHVPKPNPDYLADAAVLARLYEYAKALALGEPLLVMGESAAGKTSDLEYLFFRMNRSLRYKNMSSDTSIEEVVGGYVPGAKRGEMAFSEGMLPKAMEEGGGAFLDELNLNPLAEWLNTVIDDGRLYLPHRIVEGRPYLVAAANPPEPRYAGRILLSPATRSRYTEIWAEMNDSEDHLTRLWKHWLRGGVQYALAVLLLPLAALFAASPAGTLGAFPRLSTFNPFSWLKRLPFLGKKKARTPEAEEGVEGPPSFEDLLRKHNIPESEWPAYRAKAEQIQAVIRLVGTSIGRDARTRWEPGPFWAYYLNENKATYPMEHLITHGIEEIIGAVAHEGTHREITRLDERLPLVRKYLEDPMKHLLWNALEDPRVNSRSAHRLPGSRRYLDSLYSRYLPESPDYRLAAVLGSGDGSMGVEGDGASAFGSAMLRYPHIEFLMASNYFWRYGKPPPQFLNRAAREAFEKALPEMREIFADFPREQEPSEDLKLAHSLRVLERIDKAILPLYEPLIRESQKRMARDMKGKGKSGKGSKGGKSGQSGSQGPATMPNPESPKPPPQNQEKPKEDKKEGAGGKDEKSDKDGESEDPKKKDGAGPGEKKDDPEEKPEKGKGGDSGEKKDDPSEEEDDGEPFDENSKEAKETRRRLEDMARGAAKKLGGQIRDNPKAPGKNRDSNSSSSGSRTGSGTEAPKPLSLDSIRETFERNFLERPDNAWQRAYGPVASLSGALVQFLETVFLKNARPRDVGYFRTGKRPDLKRYMQTRTSERDEYMLRRTLKTKRRYKVSLVLDESGSMENYVLGAKQALVLLLESLGRLQIDVEVIGFDEKARVHKPFRDPLTAESKARVLEELDAYLAKGPATHDGDALKLALGRIQAEDSEKRIIFVITDGIGNGPSKVQDVLAEARKAGVMVVGIGVGAGISYVQTNYDHHAVVEDIQQLGPVLKEKLERYVLDEEDAAARQAGKAQAAPSPAGTPDPAQDAKPPPGTLGALPRARALGAAPAARIPLDIGKATAHPHPWISWLWRHPVLAATLLFLLSLSITLFFFGTLSPAGFFIWDVAWIFLAHLAASLFLMGTEGVRNISVPATRELAKAGLTLSSAVPVLAPIALPFVTSSALSTILLLLAAAGLPATILLTRAITVEVHKHWRKSFSANSSPEATEETRGWERDLSGFRSERLKALRRLAESPKTPPPGLVEDIRFLSERGPDKDTRRAAAALVPLLEARASVRPIFIAAHAAELHPDALLSRSESARRALGPSLTERARGAELEQAERELREAVPGGDKDTLARKAADLERLLKDAPAAPAGTLGALPAAGILTPANQSLGRYDKFNWTRLFVIAAVGIIAVGYTLVILSSPHALLLIGLGSFSALPIIVFTSGPASHPLHRRNVGALRAVAETLPKTHPHRELLRKLPRKYDTARLEAIRALAASSERSLALRDYLHALALAETSPETFSAAVKSLADLFGPAAQDALEDLAARDTAAPQAVKEALERARAQAAPVRRSPPPEALELLARSASARSKLGPSLTDQARAIELENAEEALREAVPTGDPDAIARKAADLERLLKDAPAAPAGTLGALPIRKGLSHVRNALSRLGAWLSEPPRHRFKIFLATLLGLSVFTGIGCLVPKDFLLFVIIGTIVLFKKYFKFLDKNKIHYLTAFGALSVGIHLPVQGGWVLAAILIPAVTTLSAYVLIMEAEAAHGFLPPFVRAEMKRALARPNPSLRKDVSKSLLGSGKERAKALESLRSVDLETQNAYLPVFKSMQHAPQWVRRDIYAVVRQWAPGNERAERYLRERHNNEIPENQEALDHILAELDALREEAARLSALVPRNALPPDIETLLSRAAFARGKLGPSLTDRARSIELEQAERELREAAAGGEKDALARKAADLERLLKDAPAAPAGAIGARPGAEASVFRAPRSLTWRIRTLWGSSFLLGHGALALALAAPTLAFSLSLPWALGLGAAGLGLNAWWNGLRRRRLTSPEGNRDLIFPPSDFAWPVPAELKRLLAALGMPQSRSPRLGLERSPMLGDAANSRGARLGPDAVIGVGEKLATGRPESLRAALAHELGHLWHGDSAWSLRLADSRVLKPLLALSCLALATTPLFGMPFHWLLIPGLWVLGGLSALCSLAYHRVLELRADLFSARVHSPEAHARFLEENPYSVGEGLEALLSAYPSPERRLRFLRRHASR